MKMADRHHAFHCEGDREVEHAAKYNLSLCDCGAVTLTLLDDDGNTYAAGVIDPQIVALWLYEHIDALGIGQAKGVA